MIPDIPRERRKCYGIAPGAPCPAYEDGTWPEGCDCANMQKYNGDFVLPVVITLLFAIAVTCLIIWSIFSSSPAKGADNTSVCLTQKQARAKWPKDYLYWHTKERCWDNVQSHSMKVNRRLKGDKLKKMPIDTSDHRKPVDANGSEARTVAATRLDLLQYRDEAEKRLRTCCWPPPPSFIPWHDRIEGTGAATPAN